MATWRNRWRWGSGTAKGNFQRERSGLSTGKGERETAWWKKALQKDFMQFDISELSGRNDEVGEMKLETLSGSDHERNVEESKCILKVLKFSSCVKCVVCT